jgi:hypothetical protein
MFLAVFALAGISGLLAPGRTANTVLRSLPVAGLYVFYAVFAIGSILALGGVFAKGIKGPVIEIYGLGIITFELVGYGVAVFGFAGATGIMSALFPICMSLANIWRIVQVAKEMKAARIGDALVRAKRRMRKP